MKLVKLYGVIFFTFFILVGQPTAKAARYKTIKGGVKNGGTISGVVSLKGKIPSPGILKVDQDKSICGDDRPSEELIVNKDGGIKNVVVYIFGIKKGKKWGQLKKKFVYDQKGCKFIPHIMIVKAKTAGLVLNSDNVGHNFHTVSKGIFNINKKIKPNSKMKIKKNKIRKAGIVRVKCDLHSWMKGWWFVAQSPYAVLTDENGSFTIEEIPPGKYKLVLWQETLGKVEQELTIAKGKKTVNLTMSF